MQKQLKICNNQTFRYFFQKFPKFSESVRTHPNTPRRIRMHTNVSEQVQTGSNRSKHVCKLRKTCENIEKLRENVEKYRETRESFSVNSTAAIAVSTSTHDLSVSQKMIMLMQEAASGMSLSNEPNANTINSVLVTQEISQVTYGRDYCTFATAVDGNS